MEEWIFQGCSGSQLCAGPTESLRLGEAPILWGARPDPANFFQVTAAVLTPETSTEVLLEAACNYR